MSRIFNGLAKGNLGQGSLVQMPWLLISQTPELLWTRARGMGEGGRGAINPFGRKTKLNISLILQFKKATSWTPGAFPQILERKYR